jgi:hypothetical protein
VSIVLGFSPTSDIDDGRAQHVRWGTVQPIRLVFWVAPRLRTQWSPPILTIFWVATVKTYGLYPRRKGEGEILILVRLYVGYYQTLRP